jgi:hypothetical protein
MLTTFLDRFPGRWTAWVIVALMVVFTIIPIYNGATRTIRYNMDYTLWQETGQVVLAGGDIYPRDGSRFPFMYPPPCASMLAPISGLPELGFVFLLTLLNSLAWAACILLSVFLVTGTFRTAHAALYFWPSIIVIPLVHNTYLLGQPALVLLALLLGCFALLRLGRPFSGGVLLALAVAIKAYPLIAAGYFVYRRQWKALAGLAVGILVIFFVFPLLFRTPLQVKDDFVIWSKGMIFKFEADSIAQRPFHSYSFKNQSVQATVHRLTRPVPADGKRRSEWKVNVVDLTFQQANFLMLAVVLALGGFYVATTYRAAVSGPPAVTMEEGMVSLLVVFLAPLSFQYSYVWLLFPLTALLHLGLSAPGDSRLRRAAWWTIWGCVGLLLFSIPAPRVAGAYANIFLAGCVVYAGLGLILRSGWLRAGAPAPWPPK